MPTWLSKQWRSIRDSYDPDEALAGSTPAALVLGIGSMVVVTCVLASIPATEFRRPWIALILVAVGVGLTLIALRRRARGTVGTIATFLDNGLYASALIYIACNTVQSVGIGVSIALALMLLGVTVKLYPSPLGLGVVLAPPLLIMLPLFRPAMTVMLILVSIYVVVLFQAYLVARGRERERREKQLKEALGATHRIADESTQAALSTMLLGLGHFLHELRNYQTAISANLEFLAVASPLNELAQEALQEAKKAQAAEQVLVMRTMEDLKARAKPVNTVFRLSDVVRAAAQDASGLRVSHSDEVPFMLHGNPEHLRIVLHNLIRNAAQAGARTVRVDTRLEPSGQAARLVVHDDGPGIPPERQGQLFEPFGRTNKTGGTGLGLYLCRRYVELFGGTVEAEKGPMGGAAFVIRLPGTVLTQRAPTDVEASTRCSA